MRSASRSTAVRRALRTVGPLAFLIMLLPDRVAVARPVEVAYQPPVDAPVVDHFRPPSSPYGPGNRGIDYATAPGTDVRASAPGRVTFAGAVGGRLHVVVLHADGVRTSYSYLASTAVAKGQTVSAGQVLGTTGASLHFGARVGDTYIDPLLLLAGEGGGGPRLVRDDEVHPAGGGAQRRSWKHLGASKQLVGRRSPVVRPTDKRVPAAAVAWARHTGQDPTAST